MVAAALLNLHRRPLNERRALQLLRGAASLPAIACTRSRAGRARIELSRDELALLDVLRRQAAAAGHGLQPPGAAYASEAELALLTAIARAQRSTDLAVEQDPLGQTIALVAALLTRRGLRLPITSVYRGLNFQTSMISRG